MKKQNCVNKDTNNFIVYRETDRLLPKEKKKKVIGLMKDELGRKNHDKICWIQSKNL